ncbi:hypothetical protein MARPU_14860 [Marichromatium purpuratum 984]|uniref:Uncharacterized protein n=1 Tax=Marichromatium purpuratum 984 TaxID=765910 RepID=W0E9A1_MARPU|nr:hypothetical protein [Marichromatium purpuratum]AHF05636.1 hypothetical protein MARPU_14860 [Marichromatium purpuratum 984]
MAKALIQAPFGPIAVDWRGGALAGIDLVAQGEENCAAPLAVKRGLLRHEGWEED